MRRHRRGQFLSPPPFGEHTSVCACRRGSHLQESLPRQCPTSTAAPYPPTIACSITYHYNFYSALGSRFRRHSNCRAKELVKPLERHMTTSLLSAVARLFSFVYKNQNSPQLPLGLTHRTRDTFYNLALASSSFSDSITVILRELADCRACSFLHKLLARSVAGLPLNYTAIKLSS